MKKAILIALVTASAFVRLHPQVGPAAAQRPKLDERLSVYAPFIGPTSKESIRKDPRMREVTLKWEVLLNGHAVRLTRAILNSDHRLETTYYWDQTASRIAFLALSNNGVIIKGFVTVLGNGLISEGLQRGPEIDRTSRRTYSLDKDGKLYEDDQFCNSDTDDWRRTHVSVFVAR